MIKRLSVLLLCLMLFLSSSCAESWSGSVIATVDASILAGASGRLEKLDLTVGQEVKSGTVIGYTAPTNVYALQSGTVSLIQAQEGDIVSDTVLEIAPVSKYRIVSSTDDAYSSPETALIYGGETLYIRCTADRSHLAIGFTANLSGSSFDVFTTAGELYIGESVNLYRSPDFTYESKVGVGTVVETDPDSYAADGHLLSLRVHEGDYIERGQLLFSYASAASTDISVPADGIVTSISAHPGDSLQQDQTVGVIARLDSIRIQFAVPETMLYLLEEGKTMYYLRSDDPTDTPRKAVISGISHAAEGDTYTVYLIAEEEDLPLGLSVTVVDQTIL